ncbi:MAG TPA: hypothetical protein VKB93_22845 [Thermoanaerobaculia bacterium]|nr:hypothetical protein [Thermoanaerobaculia bacterium]
MSAIDDSALLSRYLLHEASEQEQEEIERRYFRDSGQLALLEAVEGDLIDAYVRRELPHEQRARFEKYFLCTRERRERLQMAEALQHHLRTQPRVWPRVALAVAATLLVLAAGLGVWLWTRDAPTKAVQQPVPAPPPQMETPRAPVIVAVTLIPGVTRDPAAPRTVVLGPGVDQVRANLLVEVEGEWRDLHVSLRSSGWTASNLAMNADRTVTVTIPAAQLTAGEQVLVLTSGNEPLGDYAFAVAKKF